MSQSPEPNLPSEQEEITGQSLDVLGREILNSASSWSLFWKPRFLADSSALVHLPFLFWLVEAHAPQCVVQLGVDDGVAYQAICQAIDKLGLDAACRGISLFGEREANPDAIAHNDTFYDEFSILTTEKLPTAHRHLRKGGIDLLLINTPLDSESATVLAQEWNDKLSDRGLIVVLDSKRRMIEEGAADWLDPLLETCPAIEFDQGEGLLVLAVGPDQDGRIRRLADLDLGMAGYREARQVFRRLGESIVSGHRFAELESARDMDGKALANVREQLEQMRSELSEAHSAEEATHKQLASVQASHFDLQAECEDLQERLAEAQAAAAELEKAKAARADLEARLAAAQSAAREIEKAEAVRAEFEDKLSLAEQRVADAERRAAEVVDKRGELERKLSEETERLQSAVDAGARELNQFKAKYLERLSDIAVLGHAIARQDKEIVQLRAQYEQAELHRHIQAQLAATRADLHAALNRKHVLRANKRVMNRLAEDIRLVEASDLFDAEWYLAFYPDVAEAGCDPARHFVTDGAYELRNPGPGFDSFKYHKANPDVTAEGMAAFIHYVRNGRAENRQAFPVGERR